MSSRKNKCKSKNLGRIMSIKIVVGNPLIDSLPAFSITELRVLFLAIGNIQWVKKDDGSVVKSIAPDTFITMRYSEFRDLYGEKVDGLFRRRIKEAITRMVKTIVEVDTRSYNRYLKLHNMDPKEAEYIDGFNWITTYRIPKVGSREDMFGIKFNTALLPLLNDLKTAFTQLCIEDICKFKLSESIKLYLVAKKDIRNKNTIEMKYTPDVLRTLLFNDQKRFKQIGKLTMFLNNQLLPDLNNSPLCCAEMDIVREGKFIKAYTFTFVFNDKSDVNAPEIDVIEEDVIEEDVIEENAPEVETDPELIEPVITSEDPLLTLSEGKKLKREQIISEIKDLMEEAPVSLEHILNLAVSKESTR